MAFQGVLNSYKFDFYKDKFENYQEIGEREIGGVTFQGRTYKRIGYEWTEYIAQIEEGKAVSIGIVKADISEGTAGGQDPEQHPVQIKNPACSSCDIEG